MVGSILYAAMCTRPDLSYAVQRLSRRLQEPRAEDLVAAKRVLRYLRGSSKYGITYGGQNGVYPSGEKLDTELFGYSDSDWGGDVETRRSTTGYVFLVNGGPISWASRLQPTVALSSTEAEYMAVCAAAQEAVYLRNLIGSLQPPARTRPSYTRIIRGAWR